MRIGELCAGYGGLGMGIQAAYGGHITWGADNDEGAARIWDHRFPGVPNLGDITQISWEWEEEIDLLAAGFPCQDVSCAGQRAGLRAGTRSGVWSHVARAIRDIRPPLVVLENVRGLLSADADSDMEPCPWCVGETGHEHSLRAAGAVCGDLASLGYDAVWRTVPASWAGAPHERNRVFILGWDAAHARDQVPDQAIPAWPAPDLWPAPGRGDGDPGAGAGETADPAGTRPEGATGNGSEGTERLPVLAACEHRPAVEWREYAPAIERWAAILGRPAPDPTEPGRNGRRLSAAFAEWMMGLPEGWVTGVPGLPRRDQLKAIGNGVVPQQAALALTLLAADAMSIGSSDR